MCRCGGCDVSVGWRLGEMAVAWQNTIDVSTDVSRVAADGGAAQLSICHTIFVVGMGVVSQMVRGLFAARH